MPVHTKYTVKTPQNMVTFSTSNACDLVWVARGSNTHKTHKALVLGPLRFGLKRYDQ